MVNLSTDDRSSVLGRIDSAFDHALEVLRRLGPAGAQAGFKGNDDPVTAADRALDACLKEALPRDGEGWLSEETPDSSRRLECDLVWIVDPIDGTREFLENLPEWVVSVGLIRQGVPIAGGVLNPSTGERFLGARGGGVFLNGTSVRMTAVHTLAGASVLASRSEVARGEWPDAAALPFRVQPLGSIAYKLARVAAGLADATWTLNPKHEWDVAAGAALILSNGGVVYRIDGEPLRFNSQPPLIAGGLAAHGPDLTAPLQEALRPGGRLR